MVRGWEGVRSEEVCGGGEEVEVEAVRGRESVSGDK